MKKIIVAIILLVVIFGFARYYVIEDAQKIKIEEELNFPLQKIYPQYSNLQNFVRWNGDVLDKNELFISFYEPYEGEGSSMSYHNKNGHNNGELTIIKEKKLKKITYRYFKDNNEPIYVDVFFKPLNNNKTKVTYILDKPSKTLMDKLVNYWHDEPTFFIMDKEVNRLESLLSNKVYKEKFLNDIKYDSILVEHQNEQLVLGNFFTVVNKKSILYKDISDNVEKLQQYIEMVLEKHEDEYGFPLLMMDKKDSKSKNYYYYLGVPMSESINLKDKQYSFRTIEESDVLSIYYKGEIENRYTAIEKLLKKAKKDSLPHGDVQEIFLKTPIDKDNVMMKIILPITQKSNI